MVCQPCCYRGDFSNISRHVPKVRRKVKFGGCTKVLITRWGSYLARQRMDIPLFLADHSEPSATSVSESVIAKR